MAQGKIAKGRDLELLVVLSLIVHLNLESINLQELGSFLRLILPTLTAS